MTTGRILVANPGHLPWMPRVAAGLQTRGELAAYCAPVATNTRQVDWVRGHLPGWLAGRVATELRRRQVPGPLEEAVLVSAAFHHELINVLARRARVPDRLIRPLADWRDAAFDASVARRLDGRVSAAIVAYAASQKTLARSSALGVRTFLDYPVAHHAFDERLLQEEQRLAPDYAGTMQFHRPSSARKLRLEAEIDQADRILTLSEFHRRSFLESGVSAEKLTAVPPFGVDLDAFSPGDPRERYRFTVLFLGQITQRKGVSYLVAAFERAAIPNAELLFIGRPYGTRHPWRATPGLRHIEMVAPWETPDLYRSADVMVLPALSDAAPRVVLEAMACGIPVIVSDNTGTADAVEDGVSGYVVPIRDVDAIADRMLALHRDREHRAAMGQAARQAALRYAWSNYVDAVSDLATSA